MSTQQLSIKEWSKFHKELAENFWPAVERGLKSGARRALTILHQSVETAPPASPRGSVGAFNTGDFKRRWKFRLVSMGNAVEFYNEHPAAPVIEDGRRPGAKQPPVDALVPWVRRKLHVTKQEAKGIAYVVARAIGKRGLRARKVLGRALVWMQAAIEGDVEHELDRVLEKGRRT